jgi:hypothetical protein
VIAVSLSSNIQAVKDIFTPLYKQVWVTDETHKRRKPALAITMTMTSPDEPALVSVFAYLFIYLFICLFIYVFSIHFCFFLFAAPHCVSSFFPTANSFVPCFFCFS